MDPSTLEPPPTFGKKLGLRLRLLLLVTTFSGVVLVLGKNLLMPSPQMMPVPPLSLPAQVPLPGWQMTSTQSHSPPPTDDLFTWHLQQSYHYQQPSDASLTATVYYLSGSGEVGDPKNFLTQALPKLETTPSIQTHPTLGSYALWRQPQQQHLVTCLTPNGQSTANNLAFRENRFQAVMTPTALQNWILGKRSFLDKRCLWTHMILKTSTPEIQNSAILEQAWAAWTHQWQTHLPNS